MSTQSWRPQGAPLEGAFIRTSGPLSTVGTTRMTGKLLATQGYVVGIEISGSGSRQSVAVADLEGKILHRARRPLEYVPDTHTGPELSRTIHLVVNRRADEVGDIGIKEHRPQSSRPRPRDPTHTPAGQSTARYLDDASGEHRRTGAEARPKTAY